MLLLLRRVEVRTKIDLSPLYFNESRARIDEHFYGCVDGEIKGNEAVDDEGDDVGSSACGLQSPHLASFVLDACLLSKGVCWLISTLCS